MKRLVRISAVVLSLALLTETQAFQFQKRIGLSVNNRNQNRNLELQCIPDEEDILLKENEKIENVGHKYDSYSQGDVSIQLIQGLRRKPKSYYEGVVNNVIMALCDVEIERERCILSNSSMAAKDWNGNCIQAADTVCPTGYCEKTSNCYWNPVVVGQNRTMRFPEDDYKSAEKELLNFENESYIMDLAKYSIVGIIFAALLLVLWFLYFIGRYCCCCLWTSCSLCYLCSPIPKEEGYNVCLQWIIPAFLYLVGLIGIIFCGVMSFIGNEDVNVAATGVFAYLSALMGDLGRFLAKSKRPLVAITSIVFDAGQDAFAIFNDTAYVKSTANDIVGSFSDFMPLHIQGLQQSGNEEGYSSARNAFSAQVTPVVDEIQGMLDTLENDVYDNVDTIQTSLDSAVSQIDSFETRSLLWQNDVHDYEGIELEFRSYRLMGVLGIFLASGIIALMGFIGILVSRNYRCRKLHSLMDIAGLLSALLGSIAFVLASVTMLMSFLWYDICEVSEIVTSNFEPILGETIAKGANAIFNDTNLAVAFNVTDKIDFEEKLDKGLEVIEDVNITEQFDMVVEPLEGIQDTVGDISITALSYFNMATKMSLPGCMFDDEYSTNTILQPWLANTLKGNTTWKLFATGEYGSYERQGGENATQYISRIYSIAGTCSSNPIDCCLNGDCALSANNACNEGSDCVFSFGCSALADGISTGYEAYLKAFDIEKKMTADLGVTCPPQLSDLTPLSCPTTEFTSLGHDKTLVTLVTAYGRNITNTASSLVNIATTSVGDAMTQVQYFLCNMNVSFVAGRYSQVRGEICGTMLGGFAQINFSLWILAIFLEMNAILINVLATRLRGISKREAMELDEGVDSFRRRTERSLTKDSIV